MIILFYITNFILYHYASYLMPTEYHIKNIELYVLYAMLKVKKQKCVNTLCSYI